MGSKNSHSNIIKDRNSSRVSFYKSLKKFIFSDKLNSNQINNKIKIDDVYENVNNYENIRLKRIRRSNLNSKLQSTGMLELCGNIMSKFSTNEISKTNNVNLYVSMNFTNIYDQYDGAETKVNNPMTYASTIIDKIYDLFSINNDYEKALTLRQKISPTNPVLKELLFANNTLNLCNLQTLNNSYISYANDEGTGALIKKPPTSKYYSARNTINTLRRPSKDEEDYQKMQYQNKRSTGSINKITYNNNLTISENTIHNNINSNPIQRRTTLNQITEFDGEKRNIKNEKKVIKYKVNKIYKSSHKNQNAGKAASYGLCLRKKIITDNKFKQAKSNAFDIFNSKILDHFIDEDSKVRKFYSSNNDKRIYFNKNTKKKKKNLIEINLKDIIKQERKEASHRSTNSANKENGRQKNRRNINHIKNDGSVDFKDSIDKYLTFIYNSENYVKKKSNRIHKLYKSNYSKVSHSVDKILAFTDRHYSINENSESCVTILQDDLVNLDKSVSIINSNEIYHTKNY